MASGEIDITPGRTLSATELVDNSKLNDLGLPIARVKQAAITAREIADGSITSDKLDVDLEAQIGVADGSVTTAKIVDDAVTAAKLADDVITAWSPLVTLDSADLIWIWDVSASTFKKITYGNLLAQIGTILTGTATVDPPSIASGADYSFNITVTGAVVGDTVIAAASMVFPDADFFLDAPQVISANTVQCFYVNGTGGSYNPPSHTVRATVFHY